MEAVRTSETSVYYNKTTLRYIPEAALPGFQQDGTEVMTHWP
jgi:hypothetical protein